MNPINKPFDRLAKELGDDAPLLLLRSLKLVGDGDRVTIRHLRPETSPPVRLVDLVAALAVEEGREFIFHLEFCVSYDSEVLASIACYGGSLVTQYRGMRVDSVLVLLDRRRPAVAIPSTSEYVSHETRIVHPFRTVRLWELDPAPILASEGVRFLPWAVLMNSSEEQVRDVAARLRSAQDEEATARFLTLGSFRYHREELEHLIGGAYMGLMEAILEGSSLVHDREDKAREAGIEAGLEAGRDAERRRLLRTLLSHKFPGLDADPAIDSLNDADVIERIFLADSRAEVERMLREASQRS